MSTPYQDAVLADGPLALWPLTERAGSTTALDVTGNGFDASYPGDGSVTLGVAGPGTGGCCSCVQFNDTSTSSGSGRGPGLSIANAPNLPLNPAQLTIEAWLQPIAPADTTTSFSGCVLSWGNDPTQSNPKLTWLLDALIWPSGAPCALTYPKLQDGDLSSSGILRPDQGLSDCPLGGWPVGSWHHLAVCADRTTPANNGMYLDGEPWAAGLFYYPFTPRSDPITFGTIGSVLYETWCGGMAYVALYTKCLTQAQVQAHVAASLCPASWLRLRHASGRSYVQQNGEQVQVVAGGVGVLDLPLPALAAAPARYVGIDAATGLPAAAPLPPLPPTALSTYVTPVAPAPVPAGPTADTVRCGAAHQMATRLTRLYNIVRAAVGAALDVGGPLVASAIVDIALDILTEGTMGTWIAANGESYRFMKIVLGGAINAIEQGLLPPLDATATHGLVNAAYEALPAGHTPITITQAALDQWATNIGNNSAAFLGAADTTLRLLVPTIPLDQWQQEINTGSQYPSSDCA